MKGNPLTTGEEIRVSTTNACGHFISSLCSTQGSLLLGTLFMERASGNRNAPSRRKWGGQVFPTPSLCSSADSCSFLPMPFTANPSRNKIGVVTSLCLFFNTHAAVICIRTLCGSTAFIKHYIKLV